MGDGIATYNRGHLLFVGDWGPAWVTAFVVAALAVLVLTWLDTREMSRRRRALLLALRTLSLSVAIALLLEPALELKHVTKVKNHIPVLVDVSASQRLPGLGGDSRADNTRNALERLRPLLTGPNEDHIFDLLAVGADGRPVDLDELTGSREGPLAPPRAGATHLWETLSAKATTLGPRELGGFVIVSDGIDNGALGNRVKRGEALDAETRAALERFKVPVHTIATAGADELRDIAVERVLHDEFAFIRNAVKVEADIRVTGFDEGALQVSLEREGRPLQTRPLALEPGKTTYRVAFEFVPELIGKEVYSVSVPVRDGEALAENNRQFFILNLIRDKIRALHVVGQPSWDQRFLRQLLKGNPNVDLISFFILRTPDDLNRAPNSEMSLIPFPTDELFDEQLGSFDLVIFQNFTYEPYNMRQRLPQIRDYVRNGGAVVMIGGDVSFSSGGYEATPMAEILPTELVPGRSRAATLDDRRFRPELTDAGRLHPITRIDMDAAANRQIWSSLPELPGTSLLGPAKKGATVLATHPQLRSADGSPMPVIAVSEQGKGRTMAVAFDGSWRWSFDRVVQGSTSRAYTAFWNGAIRWLMRDPELNLVQLDVPALTADPGSSVGATVRLFEPDYQPAAGKAGTLTVIRRALDRLAADPGTVVGTLPFTADDRGRVELDVKLPDEGVYTLRASVIGDEGTEIRDEELVLAVASSLELADIEPRNDLLAALAGASGGVALEADEVSPSDLTFAPAQVEQVNRRRVIDLWNSGWVLALLGLLLGAEWTLRRRWGRL